MGRVHERRIPREDLPPAGGRGLAVRCAMPDCARAAVLDPHALFGARRLWPAEGVSTRFRCRCGGRQARISYLKRAVDHYGPIDRASLDLRYA